MSYLEQTEISQLSFEDALKKLEEVVQKLDKGQVPLEEAVQDYEYGASLKAHCDKLLADARLKINEIMVTQNGDVSVTPSSLENLHL